MLPRNGVVECIISINFPNNFSQKKKTENQGKLSKLHSNLSHQVIDVYITAFARDSS